jgi:hypothetical protein
MFDQREWNHGMIRNVSVQADQNGIIRIGDIHKYFMGIYETIKYLQRCLYAMEMRE